METSTKYSGSSTNKASVLIPIIVGLVCLVAGGVAVFFLKDILLKPAIVASEVTITKGLIKNCSTLNSSADESTETIWYEVASDSGFSLVTKENPFKTENDIDCILDYTGQFYIYDESTKKTYSLNPKINLGGEVSMRYLAFGQDTDNFHFLIEDMGIEFSEFYIASTVTQAITKIDAYKTPSYNANGSLLIEDGDSLIFQRSSESPRPWGEGDTNALTVSSLNLKTFGIADLVTADDVTDYKLLGTSADNQQVYVEKITVKSNKAWDDFPEKGEFSVISFKLSN